jgi:hypothetical protein
MSLHPARPIRAAATAVPTPAITTQTEQQP